MYLDLINNIKSIILSKSNPESIYIYGSFVRNGGKDFEDIDIAFEDKKFDDISLIISEIEKLNTLVKIDVKNLAFCEERFKARVKSEGKVIYSQSILIRAQDGLYNFNNVLKKFEVTVVDKANYQIIDDEIYPELVIKRFELTYEMSWKAIKRLLEYKGIICKFPLNCFKEAFSAKLISSEEIWLEIIETRNLASHVYNLYEINLILDKMPAYLSAFIELKNNIEKELTE